MDLGVAPARRFHHSVQMMSVALLRGRYADFGLTFAAKKLAERPMALVARTGRWTRRFCRTAAVLPYCLLGVNSAE